MTASKVMSAIKVDMCHRQRPLTATGAHATASAPAVASPPNVLDVIRAQRRRGGGVSARVCLFGAPEPGATRVLYDQMLQQQRQLALSRYQFDLKTERYVGADSVDGEATDAGVVGVVVVDQLQQRLQSEQQPTAADVDAAVDAAAATAEASSSSGVVADDADDSVTTVSPVAVVTVGRVKPTKSTASLRHTTKPYDKPAVRPITGKLILQYILCNSKTSKAGSRGFCA